MEGIDLEELKKEYMDPSLGERYFISKYGLCFYVKKGCTTVKQVFSDAYGRLEANKLVNRRNTNVKYGYDLTSEKKKDDMDLELDALYEKLESGYDQGVVDEIHRLCVKIERQERNNKIKKQMQWLKQSW